MDARLCCVAMEMGFDLLSVLEFVSRLVDCICGLFGCVGLIFGCSVGC